jgi:DNA-binding transcriptional LysR family regulator
MELGSNEAIKQAVIDGLGLSVLSSHTLALDAPAGQFVILNVQGFLIQRHRYFAYPAGKQLSNVARTFVDYLRQAAEHIGTFPAQKNGPVG